MAITTFSLPIDIPWRRIALGIGLTSLKERFVKDEIIITDLAVSVH
jgi:hypothetical protein